MTSTDVPDNPTSAPAPRRHTMSKGDRQRENILEAVEKLLGEIAVPEITVKDITDAAGIKRPSFYFYYESKYDVLGELVSGVWDTWVNRTAGFHRRGWESQLEYYDRLSNAAYSTWVDHDTVMVAGLQAANFDERLGARWGALVKGYNREIAAQISWDAQAGLIEPVSDDHLGLIAILTDMSVFAYYQDRLLKPSQEQSERMRANLRRVWDASVGIRPPADK